MVFKEVKKMEYEELSPVQKTMNGAFAGSLAGAHMALFTAGIVAANRGQPLGLIRTLKTVGMTGASSAAIAGLYMGTEQLMQKQGMKKNYINYAVGGLVTGGLVIGRHGKSIPLYMGVASGIVGFLVVRMQFEELEKRPNLNAN